MESELTVGLAGEKIKVTLEGEPADGVELGAEVEEEEELDPEAEALEVTAAAATEEVEEAVMVGRLGMEEEEVDMLVVAGIEADVEAMDAEEAVEEAAVEEIGVMESEEVMLVAEAEVEAEDMDEEEATSSMFIMLSDSSTESDIDCKSSCEAAAGFQSG